MFLEFAHIKKPYTNKSGVKVEEYAKALLNHPVEDKFYKESVISLITMIGTYIDNKTLVVLADEKEPAYPCGAFDRIDYKSNLEMVIDALQIVPSKFDMLQSA